MDFCFLLSFSIQYIAYVFNSIYIISIYYSFFYIKKEKALLVSLWHCLDILTLNNNIHKSEKNTNFFICSIYSNSFGFITKESSLTVIYETLISQWLLRISAKYIFTGICSLIHLYLNTPSNLHNLFKVLCYFLQISIMHHSQICSKQMH